MQTQVHSTPQFLHLVNGGWTAWAVTKKCSLSNNAWTQTSERNCTNPTPAYGGLFCSGLATNILSCPARKIILFTFHYLPCYELFQLLGNIPCQRLSWLQAIMILYFVGHKSLEEQHLGLSSNTFTFDVNFITEFFFQTTLNKLLFI